MACMAKTAIARFEITEGIFVYLCLSVYSVEGRGRELKSRQHSCLKECDKFRIYAQDGD